MLCLFLVDNTLTGSDKVDFLLRAQTNADFLFAVIKYYQSISCWCVYFCKCFPPSREDDINSFVRRLLSTFPSSYSACFPFSLHSMCLFISMLSLVGPFLSFFFLSFICFFLLFFLLMENRFFSSHNYNQFGFLIIKCFACICEHETHTCLSHAEARRRNWMPWEWSYGCVWVTMWPWELYYRYSAWARGAHNCWIISPATPWFSESTFFQTVASFLWELPHLYFKDLLRP